MQSQNSSDDVTQICEKMYISNLVYRHGPIRYKGREYLQPIYSDKDWDTYKEQYKTEYENFSKTIPTSIQLLPQIQHPIICGSLQKYTANNYNTFINRVQKINADRNFVITPKYDGCSMRVYFYPDKKILCMNRNECDYGIDLTSRCQNILNQINQDYIFYLISKCNLACVAIRGELIIPQKTFQDEYTQTYASVQNATTAKITCMKDQINSDFVIYEFLPITCLQRGQEIIDLQIVPSYLHQLKYIEQIVKPQHAQQQHAQPQLTTQRARIMVANYQYCLYEQLSNTDKFKEFYDKHNNNPYPCDGVVIKLNTYQKALFENKLKPLYQIAYKFQQDNQLAIPLQINWSVNGQYELVPTLNIQPVKIGPKTVSSIAMSNLNKCYECDIFNKIQQARPVQVCLAGKIIPQIAKEEQTLNINDRAQCEQVLTKNMPSQCPSCGGRVQLRIVVQTKSAQNKSTQYKYVCAEQKCRNKIICTKFLKHFKPYLKAITINGKQTSVGEKRLMKLITDNNNNLDGVLKELLAQIYKNGVDIRNMCYLTFCTDETPTSIEQKTVQGQEQKLIDDMFLNLSVRKLNLLITSDFLQELFKRK